MTEGNPQLYTETAEQLAAAITADLDKRLAVPPGSRSSVLGGSVQLFGRLGQILISRINEVPEQHFRAFLNEADLDRLPPQPAHCEITFLPAPDGLAVISAPKGTQVATRPSGDVPEVVFETERTITVTPAQLAACISADAVNASDHTSAARGDDEGYYPAFAGEIERDRLLLLGDELFAFPDADSWTHGSIAITFKQIEPDSPAEATPGAAPSGGETDWRLQWLYWNGTDWSDLEKAGTIIEPTAHWFDACEGTAESRYELSVLPKLEPSLERDIQAIWLAVRLTGGTHRRCLPSLSDIQVQQSVTIKQSQPRPADAAFAAIQGGKALLTLDPATSLQPLGPQPSILDTMYLRMDDALQKAGALITLDLVLPGLPPNIQNFTELDQLKIAWEYYSTKGWELLGYSRRGCPELERMGFDLIEPPNTPFPKPKLRKNTVTRKKLLEFAVPSDYADKPLPGPFATTKVLTDVYTGQRFVEIPVPDGCKDIADDLLVGGCYTAAAGHPDFIDKTCALTTSGIVRFRLPQPDAANGPPPPASTAVNGQTGYWVRARLVEGSYNEPRSIRQTLGQTIDLPPQVYAPIISQLTVAYADYTYHSPVHRVQHCYSRIDGRWQNQGQELALQHKIYPFTGRVEKNALYMGFLRLDEDILVPALPPGELLELCIDVDEDAAPSQAVPLKYEYWNGRAWQLLRTVDETRGLLRRGYLRFYTPVDHAPSDEFGRPAYWLRVTAQQVTARQDDKAPAAYLGALLLNTVPAVNATTVREEILGSSTGKPRQPFTLAYAPVLPDLEIQVLEREAAHTLTTPSGTPGTGVNATGTNGAGANLQGHDLWMTWDRVDSFFGQGPESRCYVLDQATGTILFGDGSNGKIPAPGSDNIRAAYYRAHRGQAGNVPAGTISDLRNPQGDLGSVDRVHNRAAAVGGGDAEPVAQVRQRGPQVIRHRNRAVAQGDYQWLALEIPGVARVYPLAATGPGGGIQPGWVTAIVVPQAQGHLPAHSAITARPTPTPALLRLVRSYLEARVLANLSSSAPRAPGGDAADGLHLRGPDYMEVCVTATIVAAEPAEGDAVKLAVARQLEDFLHPLTGGPQRTGWMLGRDVYISEVADEIESVPGVDHVVSITLSTPAMQYWRLEVAEVPLAYDFAAGSQVSLLDERIRLMLAQPLTRPAQMNTAGEQKTVTKLAIYGFKVGDEALLLPATGSAAIGPAQIDAVDQDAGTLTFVTPLTLPVGDAEGFALQSPDGKLCLPVAGWVTTPVSDGRSRLAGVKVGGFAAGDRISLVHARRRSQIQYPLLLRSVTSRGAMTHLYVPESYLVCSGSHTVNMV